MYCNVKIAPGYQGLGYQGNNKKLRRKGKRKFFIIVFIAEHVSLEVFLTLV